LHESQRRFQLIAENLNGIVWKIEPETLRLRYGESSIRKDLGAFTKEIEFDPTAISSIHPDDTARILEKLERLETANHLEDEYRIICPGGRIKWSILQRRQFGIPKVG